MAGGLYGEQLSGEQMSGGAIILGESYLWGDCPGGNSPRWQLIGGQLSRGNCPVPHRHSVSKELMFLVCHVIMKYGWEPLMVSHHRAKLGDHCRCDSRDIMFLVI